MQVGDDRCYGWGSGDKNDELVAFRRRVKVVGVTATCEPW